jgi:hypothetical protein
MKILAALLLLGLSPSFEITDDFYLLKHRRITAIQEKAQFGVSTEGIFYPGKPMIYTKEKPDEWEEMNLNTQKYGYMWDVVKEDDGSPLWWAVPLDACASIEDCTDATEEMCKNAGHGGVQEDTVEITQHANDSGATCSGDCDNNGAVAFVDCN